MARYFNDSWARNLFAANPFMEMQRDFNRLFGDTFRCTTPRVDVRETDDEVCVVADLPGVAPADLDVRVDGSLLTITAERHGESERGDENYHLMERTRGMMRRSVPLPFSPDPGEVHARYDNGVLSVHMPKSSLVQRGHRIDVKAGETGRAGARGFGSVDVEPGGTAFGGRSERASPPGGTEGAGGPAKPAEGVAWSRGEG